MAASHSLFPLGLKHTAVLPGLLLASSTWLSVSVNAASFACEGDLGRIESAICSSDSLSKQDERLVALYQSLQSSLPSADAEVLKADQVDWLHGVRRSCDGQQPESVQSCLSHRYSQRIAGLETLQSGIFPPLSHLQSMCDDLSRNGLETPWLAGLQEGYIDIDNDGRMETTRYCSGGSMGSDCMAFESHNGEPLTFSPEGYDPIIFWSHGQLAFRHQGQSYFLHAYDDAFREPSYVSYVTPEHKEYVMCEFETEKTPVYTPKSEPVCASLNQDVANGGFEATPFTTERYLGRLNLDDRRETFPVGTGELDYDNDGTLESVVELKYSSGAGRGCDIAYIDAVSNDGRSFLTEAERQTLLSAQNVLRNDDPFEIEPQRRFCQESDNGYLEFESKIYLSQSYETGGSIVLIENDEHRTVCDMTYRYESSVKAISAARKSYEGVGP